MEEIPKVKYLDIPAVTSEQMSQIDEIATKDFGVEIEFMMEHASRLLANLSEVYLSEGKFKKPKIVVLAGKGNNGGGVLTAARYLVNKGYDIQIITSSPIEELYENAERQAIILEKMNSFVELFDYEKHKSSILEADFIIEGLLGYSILGDPKPPISQLIDLANNSEAVILSNDIPSGLNPDNGMPGNPTIKATATLTLALPKVGILGLNPSEYTGKLFLGNIHIPQGVYEKIGITITEKEIYNGKELLELTG